MLKNTAQKLYVVAADADGRVSGDAANITATYSIDGGAPSALADTNPVEIGTTGVYAFDVSAAESNGDALVYIPSSSTPGVEIFIWPSHYPAPTPVAAADASGSVTGGLFNGSTVRIYQDDDVTGDFAIVFDITNPSIDFTAATAALFDAGTDPGTPLISGNCTINAKSDGAINISVAFAPAALQLAALGYPYTLKVVFGTTRHTIHSGTLDLSPTYQTFR